ncbi:hypothetical protein D3C87_1939850 [compost metagenome]
MPGMTCPVDYFSKLECGRIPQFDGLVHAASSEEGAIRTECNVVDRVHMRGDVGHDAVCIIDVPDFQVRVPAGGEQVFTFR